LGILSSVGLGTGLHTFVLYLGPYIAMVTLAVTECDTMTVPLDGPNALVCPPVGAVKEVVTFGRIVLKVLPAAFLWGAGTAIGELPPYFVSRAARLSGQKLEELDELEEEDRGVRTPSTIDRLKLVLFHALQRWGFWAIVLCASVPNPLFDLAGLTCGHFLIPFWTFFGATFLGKAVVKVQIQAAFVILAFDKDRLAWVVDKIEQALPAIQGKLGPIFEKQRAQFHKGKNSAAASSSEEGAGWVGFVWNWFLGAMLLWFVKSIVESSVQERLAERDAATIEAAAIRLGQGVTTRLQEQRQIELAAAAAAASGEKQPLVQPKGNGNSGSHKGKKGSSK
jgi:membrane protein YqaA with SNARE-associated domain